MEKTKSKFFEPFVEENFCPVRHHPRTLKISACVHYDLKNCSVVAGVSVSLQRTCEFDVIVVMISCLPANRIAEMEKKLHCCKYLPLLPAGNAYQSHLYKPHLHQLLPKNMTAKTDDL
jgi:hypothetical protein